jgi:glycosyltransferase involved in cell wall biosynthesis
MDQLVAKNPGILVSVDMITYKHEQYIAQAIEGVLMQQTNFNYELVIANDCSPDNTDAIVKHYINHHPKGHLIKYFRHEMNLGMQKNGLFAVQQCYGKYIALCEGDDYWTDPLKLQKQVDFMEANPEVSLCGHSGSVLKDDFVNEYYSSFKKQQYFTLMDLIRCNPFLTASVCFRQSVLPLPDWYFKVHGIGDYSLYYCARLKGELALLPDNMCIYRVHAGGIWSSHTSLYGIVKNGIVLVRFFNILAKYYPFNWFESFIVRVKICKLKFAIASVYVNRNTEKKVNIITHSIIKYGSNLFNKIKYRENHLRRFVIKYLKS